MQLISSLRSKGIDPFHRFEGEKYKLLIPMRDLENFAYVPAYGAEYRRLGIVEATYGANPTMYGALYKLDKLAGIWGVRFNVREAWRPLEWQEELHRRMPDKVLKPRPGKNLGHVAGDAADLTLAMPIKEHYEVEDKDGRTIYDGWRFKAYPQPQWETSGDKLNWIEPLGIDFDNVKNPLETAHLTPSPAAPNEFRLRIALQDFSALMRRNIPNMRNINDESWHSQGWSKDREYSDFPNLSIKDVLGAPESRMLEVKKEVEDWAEATFAAMYDMPYEKGVKHNFSTDDFREDKAIHLDWQINDLALIANKIRALAESR